MGIWMMWQHHEVSRHLGVQKSQNSIPASILYLQFKTEEKNWQWTPEEGVRLTKTEKLEENKRYNPEPEVQVYGGWLRHQAGPLPRHQPPPSSSRTQKLESQNSIPASILYLQFKTEEKNWQWTPEEGVRLTKTEKLEENKRYNPEPEVQVYGGWLRHQAGPLPRHQPPPTHEGNQGATGQHTATKHSNLSSLDPHRTEQETQTRVDQRSHTEIPTGTLTERPRGQEAQGLTQRSDRSCSQKGGEAKRRRRGSRERVRVSLSD
ncbi:hypothetical protein F511_29454 [Dorcoceras hygrometricum]|uniref:Uncharacterized protein n=1 Tax=Dorcoceras hygrometricum TaxID=472368 RepID=A0A2Z7A6K4_9LAMI|nr:hypothetical protein F511_29454 [Dorcoceras hygrometricum]